MIAFPDIAPKIFTLDLYGKYFSLRWYTVSYLAAFFEGFVILRSFVRLQKFWRLKTPQMELDQVKALVTCLTIGVILGGRLGYLLFYNFSYFIENLMDFVLAWDGEMSFHGGFTGVTMGQTLPMPMMGPVQI